jgi:nicotinamidase-related amidase
MFRPINQVPDMRILKEEAAGVVIDIQERLLPHIQDNDIILRNCLKLIEGLRILSVPVLVTQQYTRGLGPSVPPIIKMFPEFSHIEKISFSCCEEPVFEKEIALLGKTDIILCGIETHVCVLQTCLDLLAHGKRPVVVEDCVSSRKQNDKIIAIERMRQEGASITTVESLLFELMRTAGNDMFKGISTIVK